MGATQGWWLVLMAWARLADDGGSLEREKIVAVEENFVRQNRAVRELVNTRGSSCESDGVC